MPTPAALTQPAVLLLPFGAQHAARVAGWVSSAQELQRLAPATEMPLTAEKVVAWTRDRGMAFVAMSDTNGSPIAYGELNPMRRDAGQVWLGHAIVAPQARGRGMGSAFVRALIDHAFDRLQAHRVSLIVFPSNHPALTCYRSVGFVPVGEEYHRFGAGSAKHRMVRLEIRHQGLKSLATIVRPPGG